jgi:hypothetical protein
MHDPSSRTSQLICKNARESKIKTQNPKLQKFKNIFRKSSYHVLIFKKRMEIFETLGDSAENHLESVWFERNSEKMK